MLKQLVSSSNNYNYCKRLHEMARKLLQKKQMANHITLV